MTECCHVLPGSCLSPNRAADPTKITKNTCQNTASFLPVPIRTPSSVTTLAHNGPHAHVPEIDCESVASVMLPKGFSREFKNNLRVPDLNIFKYWIEYCLKISYQSCYYVQRLYIDLYVKLENSEWEKQKSKGRSWLNCFFCSLSWSRHNYHHFFQFF